MKSTHSITADYLVIGAGIIGLCLARELIAREPKAKIIILEKEERVGVHASGRNSGVLHSGIYYPENSLKGAVCAQGARAMAAYCDENKLPINRIGKLIVPIKSTDEAILSLLYQRAKNNGARVEMLDEAALKQIEPLAKSATGNALYSPDTAVVDSVAILNHLYESLFDQGVEIYFNHCSCSIDVAQKRVRANGRIFSYGHLFNTAGLFADKIAEECGLKRRYTLLPFKGIYHELAPNSAIKLNHLLYPVPDMGVPFLGVHFTKSVSGCVYVGPTAVPALGRENYRGISGANWHESLQNLGYLGRQYLHNVRGFRTYVHQEVPRFLKSRFVKSAQNLVPSLQSSDLIASAKVGIRAQLYDRENNELVMDFLMAQTSNETHVLNAVSPAFTSAFSFVNKIIEFGG